MLLQYKVLFVSYTIMKLLSFDVGIKNLSFCLFEVVDGVMTILKWDNINLIEDTTVSSICTGKGKTGHNCKMKSKVKKDNLSYCLTHAKQMPFFFFFFDLLPSVIKKQNLSALHEICNTYNISCDNLHKPDIVIKLLDFSNNNCFTNIEKQNAAKANLVSIGRNIQTKLDDILQEHISTIFTIIIENQIGPIANKMKTVQGMLSQYFIMKTNDIEIEFISASNKLKDFIEPGTKFTYKERKKLAVTTTENIISENLNLKCWADFFRHHKKKDDLSDCFLQGLWFINKPKITPPKKN